MRILVIVLSLFISMAYAYETLQPLTPEKAFDLQTVLTDEHQITLQWQIAPGYYLYRDQIKIVLEPESKVKLGNVTLPEGVHKKDKIRGAYQIYSGTLTFAVPLEEVDKGKLNLGIGYQGCSADGFCYSPIEKVLTIDLKDVKAPENVTKHLFINPHRASFVSEEDTVRNIFKDKNYFMIILSFLGFGLLLAFTPCVLPMIPILSSIIVGHRHKHIPMKTFFLSLAYVLGMALSYAVAGMFVALIGSRIQTVLQQPWVIILSSLLLAWLALSLFGFYQLSLPAGLQKRLTQLSNRQKGGDYFGVFLMGAISSLIVSPCVSAPLVGVLGYIAESGDLWLGASALFALGLGMGIPLLIFGASAGKLLPKAGPWMVLIERIVGVILLIFAIGLLGRVIGAPFTLFLWGLLCVLLAIYMGIFRRMESDRGMLRHGFSILIFIYGIILMIGGALGNHDPLKPWDNWQLLKSQTKTISLKVNTIHDMEAFDLALLQAKNEGKPVIVDFYADWCSACVTMEREVFTKPAVIQALSSFVFLRIDVTGNNAFDQAVMKRFAVIAPPTFLFFSKDGEENRERRIVGEMNADHFLLHVTKIT